MLEIEKANGYGNSRDDSIIVSNNMDEMSYGIKYERLVPILVNAIKELSEEVTALSNIVCLGDSNVTDLFCADTSISSSDSRDKTDVSDFTIGLDWIKACRPVTYRWDKRTWYGTDEKPYGTPDGSKKRNRLHIGS